MIYVTTITVESEFCHSYAMGIFHINKLLSVSLPARSLAVWSGSQTVSGKETLVERPG